MANRLVVYPVSKETAAHAYQAWCNAPPQNPFYPDDCAYCRNDAFGQWVVPYLGPPVEVNGIPYPEPAGGEAMRADGVLADSVTWPDEE